MDRYANKLLDSAIERYSNPINVIAPGVGIIVGVVDGFIADGEQAYDLGLRLRDGDYEGAIRSTVGHKAGSLVPFATADFGGDFVFFALDGDERLRAEFGPSYDRGKRSGGRDKIVFDIAVGAAVGAGAEVRYVDPLTKAESWHPLNSTDMGHLHDAVKYWNETGRTLGPKHPDVRKWMLDPANYELQPSSINRSNGARLTDRYMPPLGDE